MTESPVPAPAAAPAASAASDTIEMRMTRVLPAGCDEVFDAYTDVDKQKVWFTILDETPGIVEITTDLRVGGQQTTVWGPDADTPPGLPHLTPEQLRCHHTDCDHGWITLPPTSTHPEGAVRRCDQCRPGAWPTLAHHYEVDGLDNGYAGGDEAPF